MAQNYKKKLTPGELNKIRDVLKPLQTIAAFKSIPLKYEMTFNVFNMDFCKDSRNAQVNSKMVQNLYFYLFWNDNSGILWVYQKCTFLSQIESIDGRANCFFF